MHTSNKALFSVSVLLLITTFLFSFFVVRVRTNEKDATFAKEYGLTLTNYEGKNVHLFDYRRKVLVAYAWASWCPYCGAEIQNLAKLKKTYGDSVAIVAINRGEPLAVAKHFTDQLSNTGGIVFLVDPNDSFFKEIGGFAMPETVFIDAGGAISYHQRGPIQMSEVEGRLREILE